MRPAAPCNRRGTGQNGVVIPGSAPTKGRLLLATPPLEDPNFDRTVIYVLEHHDEGALGLVLNRPSPEELGEPLDAWADLQSDPSLVFVGGPGRARRPDRPRPRRREPLDERRRAPRPAQRRPRLGRPRRRPDDVLPSISALRVFRGYSGWGPGQLEGEIEAGAWLVLDPDPNDVFTPSPTSCGAPCCAASPAAWPGSPTPPTTSPPTDAPTSAARSAALGGAVGLVDGSSPLEDRRSTRSATALSARRRWPPS